MNISNTLKKKEEGCATDLDKAQVLKNIISSHLRCLVKFFISRIFFSNKNNCLFLFILKLHLFLKKNPKRGLNYFIFK